jgi:hypothetical protein
VISAERRESVVGMTRALGVLAIALCLSCGGAPPVPVAAPPVEAPPVEAPPVEVDVEPEPESWVVPQHAVRTISASAWDPVTRTLVVVSSSGHLVLVDGASGLVRHVVRFARRADSPRLVVGAGRAVLGYESPNYESSSLEIDVLDGAAQVASDLLEAETSLDGRALASWPVVGGALTVSRRASIDVEAQRCDVEDVAFHGSSASFSPDGTHLVVVGEDAVSVVRVEDCAFVRSHEVTGGARRAAIADDGRVAVLVEHDVVVLDRAGTRVLAVRAPDGWDSLRFTASNVIVAAGSSLGVALPSGTAVAVEAAEVARAYSTVVNDGAMHDASGGESAVHGAWIRPDAEGIVVGQRGASVLIDRTGVEEIACLDGERELTWSGAEPGVAYQAVDGRCDLRTGEGTPPSPEPEYEYEEESAGDEEEAAGEDEEAPRDEVICAPAAAGVCITFPVRGPVRLVAGEGARARTLRGLDDASVAFSASARWLAAETPTGIRVVEVASGRDRLRAPAGRVVDWSADERWVVTSAEGRSAFRSLDGPRRAQEVPYALRAESVVFEAGGTSALTCTDEGIERVSLADGARALVASTPCTSLRLFGTRAVVHAPNDTVQRLVDLETGRVLLELGGDVRPPPAGSWFFHVCDGPDLGVIDVARAERRVVPGGCRASAVAEDGRFWLRVVGLETVRLERPDGAQLDLHVVWVEGAPHVYAEAPDGAFWVPSPDEVALLNGVTRTGDRVTVVPADDADIQRRLYRPTLFADFLDGRPMPTASR